RDYLFVSLVIWERGGVGLSSGVLLTQVIRGNDPLGSLYINTSWATAPVGVHHWTRPAPRGSPQLYSSSLGRPAWLLRRVATGAPACPTGNRRTSFLSLPHDGRHGKYRTGDPLRAPPRRHPDRGLHSYPGARRPDPP